MVFWVWPGLARPYSLYSGENLDFSLKGSFKNLTFTSLRQATGDPYLANLDRLRTEWDLRLLKNFSTKVIWDNEILFGDYLQTEEFTARQANRNTPYLNMDYELARSQNFFYGQSFYRAYGKFESEPLTAVVGRQKVDWGVMRMIAPTDLFTSLSIFDVEKGERVGTTAVNLALPIGSGLKINPVYAFDRDWDRSRLGLRVTQKMGHFEFSELGGRFLRDAVAGIDVTGDIEQVGVRGEFLYDWAGEGRDFAQMAAGIDYGFENSLTLAVEYFFNGQGTDNLLTARPFSNTAPFLRTVHRNFVALDAKYDMTPLWTVRNFSIWDLRGVSLFVNPETSYSLFSWMNLTLGAHLPVGRSGSEFSAIPNLYYTQAQLFF